MASVQGSARGPTLFTQAYEISKSTGFQDQTVFWISLGFHVDFWISDLFLSSMSHYRPIRANLSNEASVIACALRLNLSSHQKHAGQALAGRHQPSYCYNY